MTCQIQSLLDLFSRLFQLLQHFCMPALNALTLLVGRQEEHPAYKKLMRRWCGYLCLQCFDAVGWAAGRASGL